MAESVTIARPYAEALFRAAKESGNLAKWAEQAATLAQVAASPEVHAAIGDPNVAACGTAVDAELSNFIQLLSKNDRLALLPEIGALFESYKQAEEGIKQATIISAFPIDASQVNALVPQLESRFKSKLEASVSVDPELIGGIKVVVGDQMLDASVRGKLDAMATALNN